MIQYETDTRATDVLFKPRGRLTAFAREMRCPLGTVHAWKRKGVIPHWRRPAVLDAAKRLEIQLPAATLAYLALAAE